MKNSTSHRGRRQAKVAVGTAELSDRLTDVEEDLVQVLGSLRLITGVVSDENKAQVEPIDVLAFCRLLEGKVSDILEGVQHVNSLVDDPPKPVAVA